MSHQLTCFIDSFIHLLKKHIFLRSPQIQTHNPSDTEFSTAVSIGWGACRSEGGDDAGEEAGAARGRVL